ncbi:MAG: hypothetical protein H6920_10630 [Sphingomonadaceae bacterium]|nr:hypothetical protein [Sphingomonadaceae bacterium]MCP5383428.1 hypothetical protein [Altererythrobacter sp.]MCP5392061.1 hypothetical protein [Sphingomonadaceae bacterium]MCP5394370.1 hypothetical protein [Sphingomonadaceae bacterium]
MAMDIAFVNLRVPNQTPLGRINGSSNLTTLVGWVGVQDDGPSSIYLASDSRVTWEAGKQRWDAGRKLFAFHSSPDLLGYCGDALLPAHLLGQLTELADCGLLFDAAESAEARHAAIVERFKTSIAQCDRAARRDFTVVHAARDDGGARRQFLVWYISCEQGEISERHFATLDADAEHKSRHLFALGTGGSVYIDEVIRWNASAQSHTSRAYFTALCDVLKAGHDPNSGGSPQLVGLYRTGGGRAYGISYDGGRYFHGLPVPYATNSIAIEWRDETFQRIDGETLRPLRGAQRQVRPKFPNTGKKG